MNKFNFPTYKKLEFESTLRDIVNRSEIPCNMVTFNSDGNQTTAILPQGFVEKISNEDRKLLDTI